jgi:hypothetical protein
MSTSAGDIAKFMIAHLQDGRYGDVQILKPETAKLMHSRAFGPVADLNGMALAFFQENQNGHTIIGHGGDTRFFHSHLHLILDANVGLFISLNSAGRGDVDIRGTVFKKFIDRYFPPTPPIPPAIVSAANDAKAVAGNYITSRRGETNFLKMGGIQGEVQFAAQPDDTIMATQIRGPNGAARHYREIAPLVFRAEDGEAKLGFVKQSDGRYYIFTSGAASGFQQVSTTETTAFVNFLRNSAFIILGLTVVFWPLGALIRWHYGRKSETSASDRRWQNWTRYVCAFDLAVAFGWSQYFNLANPTRTDSSLDWYMTLLQYAGWVGVILTIIILANAIRSWRTPNRWVLSKFGDTVTLLGCVAFIWFAYICRFLHLGTQF